MPAHDRQFSPSAGLRRESGASGVPIEAELWLAQHDISRVDVSHDIFFLILADRPIPSMPHEMIFFCEKWMWNYQKKRVIFTSAKR